jgi:serine/threonine protein phosphatase PrpC
LRGGILTQVTDDHSWVAEQVRLGIFDEETARRHPMRNVVTRALAGDDRLAVDIIEFPLEVNDSLLLCSDGLSSMVRYEDIQRCLVDALPDAEEACRRLVRAANERGGKDNVTVVVVSVNASDDPLRPSPENQIRAEA